MYVFRVLMHFINLNKYTTSTSVFLSPHPQCLQNCLCVCVYPFDFDVVYITLLADHIYSYSTQCFPFLPRHVFFTSIMISAFLLSSPMKMHNTSSIRPNSISREDKSYIDLTHLQICSAYRTWPSVK